jgi:hypothetical protein
VDSRSPGDSKSLLRSFGGGGAGKAQVELEQPASPSANLGLWTGVCGGVGLILADPHSNMLGLDNVEGLVEEGRDGGEAFQASLEKNVSITDMFKGAAASRCRPVVCVGDSILRIDMVDVQGWSGNQVRRLLDGNVGSTVTLTNWSKQRAVSYTVTMTRSHVPCIMSSGNKPQLYALDVVARIQDLLDDLFALSHALSKERDGFEEHKLQARAAQEELKMVLTTAVDEADDLRGTNASLQKALEVQTEVISAYKREIYDAKDQCSLLQGQLREADDDMQEQQKSCLQLHNHVQDVEDRMQQAVVDNRKLSTRLVSKVRKGALSRAFSGFKLAAITQAVAHQVRPSVSQSLPPFLSHHFLTLDLSQTSDKMIDIVRRSTQTLVEKRGAFKALVAAVRLRSKYRKTLESALGWRGLGKIRRRCELVCEFGVRSNSVLAPSGVCDVLRTCMAGV